jgi:arylsulfatase A-like enzyme
MLNVTTALKTQAMWENTLLVMAGDNGSPTAGWGTVLLLTLTLTLTLTLSPTAGWGTVPFACPPPHTRTRLSLDSARGTVLLFRWKAVWLEV